MLAVAISADQVGQRLDRAITACTQGLSRERVKALLDAGAITRADGRPVGTPSLKISEPFDLTIALPAAVPAEAEPQDIPLSIAFEDEHIIVVDKPAGLVVHPANGNPDGTLVNALLHHCEGQLSGIGGVARPGIVHRIDKDTSGLIVAAKTTAAHEGLAKQFADHSITRAYLCMTNGMPVPPVGTVDASLARSPHDRKKIAVVRAPHAKRAVTHYKLLEPLNNAALVECRLETGRTHQVRVHMAHLGHPLLGDPVYARGSSRHKKLLQSLGFARQALHAARLGFIHPVTGERHEFKSDLPRDMQELFTSLRVSNI